MNITAFDLAERFIGELREIPGEKDHPFIQWCHMLCGLDPETPDEVPWCSSFVNGVAWLQRLTRSKSARARSWLEVGRPLLTGPSPGFDIVILKRGGDNQPGPEVLNAPGHVGFFAGYSASGVNILGGNQSNRVSVVTYPRDRVLGLRRLREDV